MLTVPLTPLIGEKIVKDFLEWVKDNLQWEIDIKRCQNYTKSYIYEILYKIRSIKQTIFNNYATNLKTTISHRSLRISDLPLSFFLYSPFKISNFDII